MLIAGLVAEGETVIEEIERIDRGYEDVVEKFTKLGANIKCVVYPEGVEILKQA
jgi:UDP-N-acetylglucosamine 1-carboxyvinyltransferase